MGKHFPHDSIAVMNPGDFWAHPDSLGLSAADVPFTEKPPGEAPLITRIRIEQAMLESYERLRDAEVGSPMRKLS